MNLIKDPWIPVVLSNANVETLSLTHTVSRSFEVADLVAAPPQRIALMRFLICLVQVALDGPKDIDDWLTCKDRIVSQCLAYLEKWKDKFNLRGRAPFMQIGDLTVEADKEKNLDILDCRLASGNNAALFDQAASSLGRIYQESQLPMNLLTFLNFSPGGKVGQANWHGQKYSAATFAAPCIKYAHTFILGDNLLDTLFFNLLCKEDDFGVNSFPNLKWGRPVWENFPKSIKDFEAFENAGTSYLGRLVPLSRFVKLIDNRQCIVGPPHKNFKIEHLPLYMESTVTVKVNQKSNDFFCLPLSSEKHMWRELPAIFTLKTGDCENGCGPPVLGKFIKRAFDFPHDHLEIWVGGLETGAQAAKLRDMLEWRFRIPLTLLGSTTLSLYQAGVSLAEKGEWILGEGVKACFRELKVEAKNAPVFNAKSYFWSHLDQRYPILFEAVRVEENLLSRTWYSEVKAALELAYNRVCPQQTPRQIQAYAIGLKRLRLKKS